MWEVNRLGPDLRIPNRTVPSVANALFDQIAFHPDGTWTRRERSY